MRNVSNLLFSFLNIIVFKKICAHNNEISKIDSLVESCIDVKFSSGECENKSLMEKFDKQTFDFGTANGVKHYTSWLCLMNNMEYFSPYDKPRLFKIMARHNNAIAKIDGKNITNEMRRVSSEMFRWTSDTLTRYHDLQIIYDTFDSFYNMFNTFVLWTGPGSLYHFNTILYAYKNVRHAKCARKIDEAAKAAAKIALYYPLSTMNKTEVLQQFFINYVSKLKMSDRKMFGGLYSYVSQTNVLPFLLTIQVGSYTFNLHHYETDKSRIDAIKNETRFVHENFKRFYKNLNVNYVYYQIVINGFIHPTKRAYTHFGSMWDISTDNGGYTHMTQKLQIEFHVYYKNKDDSLPWNYGHEMHHSMLYAVDAVNIMPAWYVEGSANRIGNRPCYEYDHELLKIYTNKTIKEIIDATYSSPFLYGMGSVLVQYLYENRPADFRHMIESKNYSVSETYETDFDVFKLNLIGRCEAVKRNQTEHKFDSQLAYKNLIDSSTFASCKNYIRFDFDDIIFVLTPDRLIKRNKNGQPMLEYTQYLIGQTHFDEINEYTFAWFMAGLVKKAVQYLSDNVNFYYKYQSSYTYDSTVKCQYIDESAKDAIINMAFKYKNIADMVTFPVDQAKEYIRQKDKAIEMCEMYMPPVLLNTAGPAKVFIDSLASPNLVIPRKETYYMRIDLKGNTVIHYAAMYKINAYEKIKLANRTAVDMAPLNADGKSAEQLYEYSLKFYKKYNQSNPLYCFKYMEDTESITEIIEEEVVEKEYEGNNTVLSNNPLLSKSTSVITEKSIIITEITTTEKSLIITEKNIISTDNNFSITFSFKNCIIFILVLLISFIVIILLNALVTLIITKKITKQKQKVQQKVEYNKDKFYTNDECTINLFD
ncbi:Adho119-like protein [Cryptophlebia peltastica nucleopolyhedrovirus]|uniref:Adho119-like protein n=1 Tax=Cryptophlebia peltastica nucleopolyhedrovirus TaxID=2304025 RepID=A0A346RNY8_9ABAC|nr:Adho119-like protein [Cryptophlebia peltastica nucleopolyhedrovirus]AXS67785.1 Adho119-like protein [Cryptophlebia peltastica nucleopolyhedrovirus]